MAKCIILAVAGAGKTHHICQNLERDKKNLVIAFTHENIKNLRYELRDAFGECPELTDVMTFDSFVYRFAVRPYMPSIINHFPNAGFRPNGITIKDPPPQRLMKKDKSGKGYYYPNPAYVKKDSLKHYVDEYNRLYCKTLCELVIAVGSGKKALIKKIANGINRCYDSVSIDEFQDFREYEFDFVLGLAKELNNVLLVGDFYQHSVAAMKNSGRPFQKGTTGITYDQFVEQMKKSGFSIDITSLIKSWRCSPSVCSFASTKLNIAIESHGQSSGCVRIVADDELDTVFADKDIVKLVNMNAAQQAFKPCRNWSYSKGDTYEKTCVILTEETSDILESDYKYSLKSPITRNKLYVAITRTKGDLLLVSKRQMDMWKRKHNKDKGDASYRKGNAND